MIVVITGPIASGKSTVARELARELEAGGVRTAVIDLDLVHDELSATGSTSDETTWMLARLRAASVANAFVDDGVAVVIADGSFNLPSDRATFAQDLRADSDRVQVTLLVSFETALDRALADPTRRRSRDPEFLGSYFAGRRDVLANIPSTDLVIDTERTTAIEAATTIARLVLQSPGTTPSRTAGSR